VARETVTPKRALELAADLVTAALLSSKKDDDHG